MSDWYQKDLAYIHDAGFGDFALQAASFIIQLLRENNITEGSIVDLGCGSGLSAREFIAANYRVLGIDISQSAIAIARKKVPEAEFRVESLFAAEISTCNAVTSIGECLNYLFDRENDLQTLTALCDRIYKGLLPGGFFIFDLLEPFATQKTQGFAEGEDWLVLYEKEESREQKKLTRRIITLRKEGNFYRRDDETHCVRLYESSEVVALLSQIGFDVQTQNNYGKSQLSKGHTVFIARK